jgi:hypothetical protein
MDDGSASSTGSTLSWGISRMAANGKFWASDHMRRGRSNLLKSILARIAAAELAERKELAERIQAGPPPASLISQEAWRSWHEYGFWCCSLHANRTCTDSACGIGASCLSMRTIGLAGDGSPLSHRDRPPCGAQNRQGRPCAMRIEAGRRRCRFHGGLSTGPRTEAGKKRISAAQRRRWARFREQASKNRALSSQQSARPISSGKKPG